MEKLSVQAFDLATIINWVGEQLTNFGLKLVGAIIVLIAGFWIVSRIGRGLANMMEKRDFEPSLRSFSKSLAVIILKVLIVITVFSMVGIQMTSFIAILGAAGLAIGMALSGTLQNFAGGVLLLILKPFKVGDFIEAQGFMGTVKEIEIFNTIMNTPDNKKIIIPNGGLADSSVDITVRAWVNTPDFWSVFFDMNEKVYEAFDREGLQIPFPQMDVHLQKQ